MKIGSVDATSVVENIDNVLLMVDGGGIIFVKQEPGIYDVHTALLKPPRNKKVEERLEFRGLGAQVAANACLSAYRWMFMHTDCMILQTKAPDFNRAVIVFAPLVGWKFEFERKEVWPTENGHADMSYFSIRYDDWVRTAPGLIERGRSFHKKLDDEFEQRGIPFENHPEDDVHHRYVGACAEMIYGGQPEKAVILYNRWARFSGYAPISILSLNPLVLNIETASLLIEDQTFTVIKCQPQQR